MEGQAHAKASTFLFDGLELACGRGDEFLNGCRLIHHDDVVAAVFTSLSVTFWT